MKYLGLNLNLKKMSQGVHAENCTPLLKKINIVKRSVLPKLIYRFNKIPIPMKKVCKYSKCYSKICMERQWN